LLIKEKKLVLVLPLIFDALWIS